MQLIYLTILFVYFFGIQELNAQSEGKKEYDDPTQKKSSKGDQIEQFYQRADWQKVEIDFLSSYYSQDGNNAAVTGGIGTEQLTDFTQKIMISVPSTPNFKINVDAAYDYYSSASTDNIDNIRSSDSSSDVRSQFGIGYEYVMNDQFSTNGRVGTSFEYDYTSFHGGLGLIVLSKSGNTALSLYGQAFYDTWIPYYPKELRGKVRIPTDKRQSYNVSMAFSQVLSKKVQASLILESTYMNGLLSTPFHRVYFNNDALPDIERLPSQRWKFPIGLRVNYHIADWLILRSYFRHYYDNWGMQGQTVSFELPVKLNRFFAIYPQYRFHNQNAVDYFLPFGEHDRGSEFYTSDFDLSELQSHSVGLGIMYSRPDGLAKVDLPFTSRKLNFESLDIKGSYYIRSTGLNAFIVSIGTKISF